MKDILAVLAPRRTAAALNKDGTSLMTMCRMVLLAFALGIIATPALAQSATPADALDRTASRFTKLDGIGIHYKSLGDGDTALVFVHGWACDLTFWRLQVAELAGAMRIVLLDLPGHGKSDKPRDIDYNIDLFSRSVHAVLQDAGVTNAVLVGQSIGVPIIRDFWRRYPNQTRGLVVINGPLRSFVTADTEAGARAQRDATAKRVQRVAQSSELEYREFMTATAEGWFVPQTPPEVRQVVVSQLLRTPPHVAASATWWTLEERLWQEEVINVPFLVMLTANTSMWSRQNEEYVRTLAPQAEYHLIENVGHFMMLERPDAINRILVQFLRKQGLLSPEPPPR